jgi:hypothetical protein
MGGIAKCLFRLSSLYGTKAFLITAGRARFRMDLLLADIGTRKGDKLKPLDGQLS